MIEFIVEFSGGEWDDYYSYTSYFQSKSKDELEFKLLECEGKLSEDTYFENYHILPIDEWKKKNYERFPVSDEQIEDSIVKSVREDLKERSEEGVKKYNTTLDRTDLKLKDWLQHAYEETLDKALYLKRAIKEIK